MSTICVFGDSIAWGAFDSESGGWAERLKLYMRSKSEIDVYNLGVSGNKTPGLLKRFEAEIKSRMEENLETVIIFAIGINDSYFLHSKNENVTKFEDFKKNIENLIVLAQKFSSKVIFVGLTPVDETKTTPIPWDTNKSFKNENIKKYNEMIKSACEKENIYFIQIFDEWIKSDYKKLLEDGLHPNAAGHEKIFEVVKDFLGKYKIIKI
ncbi:MAG TPA: GDSL-type esterase/lipase family protein [Candidatus Humimicrobiaceae bacterium]|nr:GDSL-type esterase/lipase family protein [Candidatus Humimicrobiaceae bacterium]